MNTYIVYYTIVGEVIVSGNNLEHAKLECVRLTGINKNGIKKVVLFKN